jgi:hypothetical protein
MPELSAEKLPQKPACPESPHLLVENLQGRNKAEK